MAEHSLDAAASNEEVLSRIGHMTRALHDSLRGLGLDKLIEKAASDIPDARDRLDYVARLSEQSAKRVLDATDTAGPLQDGIEHRSSALRGEWQALLDNGGAGDTDWRALAERTMAALAESETAAAATRGQLMDIMMAQDFQDLTGQVIGKITSIAQDLEKQLVQVLIDFAPSEIKRELDTGLLNGPQIKPEGNTEIVANQGQVDDLLDSLGF
ncbi:MAG: protein phosphatase CheZ [Pseudomonadota bacterium]